MLQQEAKGNARWAAVVVQASALVGVPVWLLLLGLPSNSWNFPLLFAPGLFMLAFGLAIPLAALAISGPGFVRSQAVNTLRFHSVIGLILAGLCVAFAIASQFDPPNPTMLNPPAYAEGILFAGAIAFGLVLPVLEFFRAIHCGLRAWREFV